MHRLKQNKIKIIGKVIDREKLSRFFLLFNLSFLLAYMFLIYFTVSNIIERKQISFLAEEVRANIGNLETKYFQEIAYLEKINGKSKGFDEPEEVIFAKIKYSKPVSLAEKNGL